MTILPFRDPAARHAVRGPLDSLAVSHLADRLAGQPETRTVRVDLSAVSQVDPVGAARLWMLAQSMQRAGRALRLEGLPERFLRRLRLHPLIAFVEGEESVFSNPFAVGTSAR